MPNGRRSSIELCIIFSPFIKFDCFVSWSITTREFNFVQLPNLIQWFLSSTMFDKFNKVWLIWWLNSWRVLFNYAREINQTQKFELNYPKLINQVFMFYKIYKGLVCTSLPTEISRNKRALRSSNCAPHWMMAINFPLTLELSELAIGQ